jgi:hypothetical protein
MKIMKRSREISLLYAARRLYLSRLSADRYLSSLPSLTILTEILRWLSE